MVFNIMKFIRNRKGDISKLGEGVRALKIGKLDMRCGECQLVDHCGEPFSDIAICCESRFENVDEEVLYKLLETSDKRSKKARLNNAYKRLNS